MYDKVEKRDSVFYLAMEKRYFELMDINVGPTQHMRFSVYALGGPYHSQQVN